MLSGGYHAVVANPPYITPKDPAANAAYRRRYATTCHMKYLLSSPFMERLFDLGVPDAFIGQITSNAFMKRESGKPVIEDFLALRVDLTHVIGTEHADLAGHGTPTVILFGRQRRPVDARVRAVLGVRGEEPGGTNNPVGHIWQSILDLVDLPGSENAFVSVSDLDRARLVRHPWILQGGGAMELQQLLDAVSGVQLLGNQLRAIGFGGISAEDDAMVAPLASFRRRSTPQAGYRRLVDGNAVRDWRLSDGDGTYFPYGVRGLLDLSALGFDKWIWPSRTVLGNRRTFAKRTYFDEGRPWWAWHQVVLDRLADPLSILFAFKATHNHFLLDRGGKVFNRTAPVIKLQSGASVGDHLRLLGPLNSAVGCFWIRQVTQEYPAPEPWAARHELDGTKLKQFPIPPGSSLGWAQRLDGSALEVSDLLPAAITGRQVPTRASLDAARTHLAAVRADMVATQEELDWRCLHLYGVTADDLSLPAGKGPPIERGHRAFEIAMARRMAAGELKTAWFKMRGGTPTTEFPPHWPDGYKRLVERRMALIESDRFVGLVERAENKRPWNWEPWDDLEEQALCEWLLDRLEEPQYWPDAVPRSAARLADAASRDADFVQVAELYAGTVDVDLTTLITSLVRDDAVPFLAAWRYTEAGLRTRAAWERTWDLQRRGDSGEDVGTIPVPPKYEQRDFADKASWKLRGKLDVPKERFVAYPGLGRDADPTPLVGWAGWDHLQCARALATTYEQRRSVDGWTPERLKPILAGLAELVPWLRQWHNEVDAATGLRLGDFFADFVATESAANDVGADDLAAWRPPAKAVGRRKRTSP